MIVSWFSAGVSSAVATKMAIAAYGDVHIRYHHIDDQHPDTLRFVADCEKWFGLPIHIDQSPYKNVENACRGAAFLKGPHGAACSRLLKKRLGKLWELDNPGRHTYVWGLDANEKNRVAGFLRAMPDHDHLFPLVDAGFKKKKKKKYTGCWRPPESNALQCTISDTLTITASGAFAAVCGTGRR